MSDTREQIFNYIFSKADNEGYMGMDSAQSGKFQDELEADASLEQIAGRKLSRNYIKDTVLNNYSKKQRYISEEDVLTTFDESNVIKIIGSKKDLENGTFYISYKEILIACTSASIGEWQTVFKRFGMRSNETKFAFLTCGGIKRNINEINQVKEALTSYGVIPFIVKPNEHVVSIENYISLKKNNGIVETKCKLPKPFLLLAGISGTGKSRFVRKQAEMHGADRKNFELVAVRPDWHEPSDLLGYVSRLSGTATYVATDVLRFMVAAWESMLKAGFSIAGQNGTTELNGDAAQLDQAIPYWLCLDEMNLAPVEQYFADYLSLIETRNWSYPDDNQALYSCDAILKGSVLTDLPPESQTALAANLGLDLNSSAGNQLWQHFLQHGIAIPPNLIVAGTVNMDETTHGFSRKVIDRAMSFDFGEFFPNDFDDFYDSKITHVPLTFPRHSSGSEAVPKEKAKASIQFLQAINTVLKNTPFELAYRALNELLLAVHCHAQANNNADLQAVWDDFLMQKVLPRIEGDADKLQQNDQGNLLTRLQAVLETQLAAIWDQDQQRTDFYRMQNNESKRIDCRSRQKIKWMQDRLESSGFTSFWP